MDGRSTLVRKSFPRILAYLNEYVTSVRDSPLDSFQLQCSTYCRMRSRRAYTLTFRLPQVALDARPPVSTRTQFDTASGNVEGYLNKLSRGGMFSKPKWEVRYVTHAGGADRSRLLFPRAWASGDCPDCRNRVIGAHLWWCW